jgi:hypothetical protein
MPRQVNPFTFSAPDRPQCGQEFGALHFPVTIASNTATRPVPLFFPATLAHTATTDLAALADFECDSPCECPVFAVLLVDGPTLLLDDGES